MTEDQFMDEVVETFVMFGEALRVTILQGNNPAKGGADVVRNKWVGLGNQVIRLAKESK